MKSARAILTISMFSFVLGATPVLALDPSLEVSQYAHTAWTVQSGYSLGNVYAIAQTPDGYLWLGGEFGLFRFDGVSSIPWHPTGLGKQPRDNTPYSLLITRDGTMWNGTFAGLVSVKNGKLTRYPELDGLRVTSLFEDREGTVWAGAVGDSHGAQTGRLCAIRNGSTQCYGEDGVFGFFVQGLYEDSSGALWAGAESGLWRWKPGPPSRFATPGMQIRDLSKTDDGRVLIAMHRGGLKQVVGDKIETYPIRDPLHSDRLLRDRDVNANLLLRDRDGGLWIGTRDQGLIHVHQGRTDVFKKSDGLSGDGIMSLFEDREGNVWVTTQEGLDRFRDLPVTTIFLKERLFSSDTNSVIAATDGSMWVATWDGLARWKNGQFTFFLKSNGLPDNTAWSLYQDDCGRIWVFTKRGLVYFKDGRFVAVNGGPNGEVYSITGDKAGNLWLSGNLGLTHLLDGHLVEHFPSSALGHREPAKVVLSQQGGVWISFMHGGGLAYFKDGHVRASYTAASGLGKGNVPDLRTDRDGALWVSTEEGGLSRIKDGRIATLSTKNGLPCDAIHFTMEDDDHSLWLYAACGLVRIARPELDAWIADPQRRVETALWDASDGVRLRPFSPDDYSPPAARSPDGKLWFLTGTDVQVVNPRHLVVNTRTPPVHIEKVVADHKVYFQNLGATATSRLRLPPRLRDLQIDFNALSLVAPEKVHFKYMLEGQDHDWREVVNDRQVQYSNLPPGNYRFRVGACNNSGVWNEQEDVLEFFIAPAYYQTKWFWAACVAVFFAMLWGIYELRVRQLAHQFNMRLEERISERTRIARDLHDTLLQSFQGLLLRFQAVINLLPGRPDQARTFLEDAIDHASRAITEGRDSISGLRMSTVEKNDLAVAIETIAEELAGAQADQPSTPFAVLVEGTPREMHPILRDEIYRLATEALRNAFQHAAAQRIEVEIRYDEKYFRIRIRDDGKGIPSDVLSGDGRKGHYGLHGMRERAKIVGGKLTIWSEADSGTEIELIISGAKAYVNLTQPFWYFGKRSASRAHEKETIERE